MRYGGEGLPNPSALTEMTVGCPGCTVCIVHTGQDDYLPRGLSVCLSLLLGGRRAGWLAGWLDQRPVKDDGSRSMCARSNGPSGLSLGLRYKPMGDQSSPVLVLKAE